jgi:cold shock protein
MKGKIKRLNENGYGFIAPEDGGPDLFFHKSDCSAGNFTELAENNDVTFEKGESPKGPKATNVTLA